MANVDHIYSSYMEELINEATQEVDNILLPLRRLHFGLPHSQEQVENFVFNKLVLICCVFVCVCVLCTYVCLHMCSAIVTCSRTLHYYTFLYSNLDKETV